MADPYPWLKSNFEMLESKPVFEYPDITPFSPSSTTTGSSVIYNSFVITPKDTKKWLEDKYSSEVLSVYPYPTPPPPLLDLTFVKEWFGTGVYFDDDYAIPEFVSGDMWKALLPSQVEALEEAVPENLREWVFLRAKALYGYVVTKYHFHGTDAALKAIIEYVVWYLANEAKERAAAGDL